MARVTIKELQEQVDFLEAENVQLRKLQQRNGKSGSNKGLWGRFQAWRSTTCLDEIIIWGTVCLIAGYGLCLFHYWNKIMG